MKRVPQAAYTHLNNLGEFFMVSLYSLAAQYGDCVVSASAGESSKLTQSFPGQQEMLEE